MLHWPVDPVSAASVRLLPEPGHTPVVYEMKWDGFRAIIWRTSDGVRIQSHKGTDLTSYFPDLTGPLTAALPMKIVIDDHHSFNNAVADASPTAAQHLAVPWQASGVLRSDP
ncbi:ATP-dependent DNA ligase [Couchioplanes caeruleus]|uniref:ATP-dependent DNA ligase family profile domain-containing protein n=2 Tax=Couchioplanes caeruleus TaxID=56438 RepID=A0A1K0FJJ4_9ACTN|nr:hypothetical protein [Couchioplanes caeruleus]OJF12904.1 hypothetical protein BG844_18045 [Couchioplanes caeruleus subsp. caeruleus]ROP28197.1 ATP dependent DNA ligase-like protein [Couchioplanes caeruleus]